MSISIIDVLAIGAGILTSFAAAFSAHRLVAIRKAKEALRESIHARYRQERIQDLLSGLRSGDSAKRAEAMDLVLKQLEGLTPSQREQLLEALQSTMTARDAFISKVLRESAELKSASASR